MQFQNWNFWTGKKFKTAKNAISRRKKIFIWFHEFFCLDFFKFSDPRKKTLCSYVFDFSRMHSFFLSIHLHYFAILWLNLKSSVEEISERKEYYNFACVFTFLNFLRDQFGLKTYRRLRNISTRQQPSTKIPEEDWKKMTKM